jgi:PIN domain nuclease of toxin-antitoxin system
VSRLAPLLLDTCAAIWIGEAAPLAAEAAAVMETVYDEGTEVYVSPISAWEIGMLVRNARLTLMIEPKAWYRRLFDDLNLRPARLPPDVLIGSSFLPGSPPNDPADRIIAATAREYGYTLVTRDNALLHYADQGHLKALRC